MVVKLVSIIARPTFDIDMCADCSRVAPLRLSSLYL